MDNVKKFEDFLGRMQGLLDEAKRQGYIIVRVEDLEKAFPELAESEDERIRKELIDAIQGLWDNDALPLPLSVKRKDAWLAWLEKLKVFAEHGDGLYYFGNNGFTYVGNPTCDNVSWIEKQSQKPQGKSALETAKEEKVDNRNCATVEPKFHEGDWVVFIASGSVCQVEKKEKYYYTLRHILGDSMPLSFGSEHLIRLWTIEDAKDGDILNANGATFIYKKHDEDCVYSYCGINLADEFVKADNTDTWVNNNSKVYPATEEQRDLLFSKMKEEGYEWDDEKKELKKIIN